MRTLFLPLLLIASYASAEIYTWTDRRGTAHYTNRLDDVPEQYQKKVKVLKGTGDKGDQTSPQQGNVPAVGQRGQEAGQRPVPVRRPAPAGREE